MSLLSSSSLSFLVKLEQLDLGSNVLEVLVRNRWFWSYLSSPEINLVVLAVKYIHAMFSSLFRACYFCLPQWISDYHFLY